MIRAYIEKETKKEGNNWNSDYPRLFFQILDIAPVET